jgi:hypothetical protein
MSNIPPRIQTEDRAFVRDTHSKGLLCTDMTALERSRRQLKLADEREARIDKLETQMNDVAELMRRLLVKLAESSNST